MRLKHLSLLGYKSFAKKTEFEFPLGITAIVGPNGTGKSNIADAIRWALGERSMSTLRAKATSDMIFAGGDSRARAGMAEVVLTFDNSDGGLPIEFSEVTISRRAYRSGENEYSMNGSQVLLRDIEELLAESSLSERTYTVIGQGVVDAALALRPEERRALFEEAAGITLYRDRREKTVDRLDETEHNLERVQDIIAEIAPRVDRLQRDANQVEQHRRLGAHLERLQGTWYGYRWGQQQAALGRALERAANLEANLQTRSRKASEIEEHLLDVRERESTLRKKLREWYRDSGDLHEEVDRARRKLAVSEERERLLKTRRQELEEEIGPLQTQQAEQRERVLELDRRVESLSEELAARRARFSEVEAEAASLAESARELEGRRSQGADELRAHRARLEELEVEVKDAQEEISRLASERAVAEERVRQLESRREEAVAGLVPLDREQDEQAKKVDQGHTRVKELKAVLEERRRQLAELEERWEAFRQRGQEPDGERSGLERQFEACHTEIARLEAVKRQLKQDEAELVGELKTLERLRATRAAYDRGAQTLLRDGLDGLLGLLVELIEVDPEWERAVAAALGSGSPGNTLQAIVVEREGVVEDVDQLVTRESGRVTVIGLDGVRQTVSAADLPPGAVSAADCVTCQEDIQPIVRALLGPVALCDDLKAARALRPDMPPGSCCVTRSGVVVRPEGTFVVGQSGRGGVLADARARREIPERLGTLRQQLAEIEGKQHERTVEAGSLEKRINAIDRHAADVHEEQKEALRQGIADARTAVAVTEEALRGERNALQHAVAELKRVRGRRGTLEKQVADLEGEHEAQMKQARAIRLALDAPLVRLEDAEGAAESAPVTRAAQGFRSRLRRAHERSRRLESEQRATTENVEALESRVDRLAREAAEARDEAARFEREMLAEVRTTVAVTEASLNSDRQALERESGLLERLRSQIDARRDRADELLADRESLLNRIQELKMTASRLDADLRSIRQRIQPAEQMLEELEREQTAMEERREQAQKWVRTAEERHGRAELEVERRRDDLQLLAEHIDEDLGLVELELDVSVTAQTPLPMHPIVSELPVVEELPEGLEDEMQFVRKRLRSLGAINPNAPHELAEVQKRYQFLTEQAADLRVATRRLRQSVVELDIMMKHAFKETFDAVADHFSEMFSHLFQGGEARLRLTEPEDLLHTGVEIVARPPGKRAQRLALLSGGERALTAVALLFSLLHVSPTPFCVLDEVDAMLDEANVGRFRSKLEELAEQTQFIVITHNRATVESADAVYGVSMGSNAVSQVVSLKLGQAEVAG